MIDPYQNFEAFVLPNGLTVYVSHQPQCSWEAVGFLIHSGAEHDLVGLEGTAHFVEHLVSENAAIPKKEILAFFNNLGGSINLGVTSYDNTRYTFFAPADERVLRQAFANMSSMLLTATLSKHIERERNVVTQEYHRIYPSPLSLSLKAKKRKHKALYSGFWLERFVRPLGTPESIGVITQEDLQNYFDTHYTPANMSVVCLGGMTLPQIIKILLDDTFAINKKGVRTPKPVKLATFDFPTETRYHQKVHSVFRRVLSKTGSYQSVTKIPISDNERTVSILAGMLNRVLNEEVRERYGWTYHIEAHHYNFRHFFEFEISCNSLAGKAMTVIEKVIDGCIAGIHDREDLFTEIQRAQIARNTLKDLSGKDTLLGTLTSLSKHHRIKTLTEINNDLSRVTMEDIRETLKWLTPDRRWTLIV